MRTGIEGRGCGVGCRDRVPEVLRALHLAVVVPDVGADCTAGTGDTHHLGDGGGRIRYEVEDEPGDYRVVVVAHHREGAGVADLEASARIGDATLRVAEEFGRGIDGDDFDRVGGVENGFGQGAGAAADVYP